MNSDLRGIDFQDANLTQAKLDGANLTNAKFIIKGAIREAL